MIPSPLSNSSSSADAHISVADRLVASGMPPELARLLQEMPSKRIVVPPRRPFRESGDARDEVIFVQSGILAKHKSDGAGRRQIVSLRFSGDGILPREAGADYGIQAIVRSEVLIGKADEFYAIVEANPLLQRFIMRLAQRHAAIGYEWLVNCGRRDSTARVAHLLCETAERSGIDPVSDGMTNPFTQQQIAEITGQTSVNVNRVFADLERQGLIRRDGRKIKFNNWRDLQRVASFRPTYLE